MKNINQVEVNKPTVCGKGYMGVGKYKSKHDGSHTNEYRMWLSMMKRCYSDKVHKRNPRYKDCSVCDEWLDFQKFAAWANTKPHSAVGFDMDKDLMVQGNKVYSPETVCFIPRCINAMIAITRTTKAGLPVGVTFMSDRSKYRSIIHIDNKQVYLGLYETAQEAYEVYVSAKESRIKEVANEWRSRIDDRVYDALMKWRVE